MRTGLPANVDGGNVHARAASSADFRRIIGPSELVTQTLPFSSTMANTRTVPLMLVLLAACGYEGVTRLSSRPLNEPALTSCNDSLDVLVAALGCGLAVAATAPVDGVEVFGVSVLAVLFGVAAESFFGVLNGLGIRAVSALKAGERPNEAT